MDCSKYVSFTSAVSWVNGTEGAATSAPIDKPSSTGASATTGGVAGTGAGASVVASCAITGVVNGIAAKVRAAKVKAAKTWLRETAMARLKKRIDIPVTFLVVRRAV